MICLVALLATASAAQAVEIPASIDVESVRIKMPDKNDFTKLSATFTCVLGEPLPENTLAQSCTGQLALQISLEDDPSYFETAGWRDLARMDVNAPIGANTLTFATPDLEDTILAAATGPNGSAGGSVRLIHVSASGSTEQLVGTGYDTTLDVRKGTLDITRTSLMTSKCGIPASLPITTSKAPYRNNIWRVSGWTGRDGFVRRTLETSTKSISSTQTYVARAPITLKLRGITYTIGTGSEFTLQCSKWGNGSDTSKHLSSNLWLIQGKVTVSGKPGANQFGAGVRVRPGFFGSERRSARVKFTVETGGKMNSANFFAAMRSTAGSISAFQLFKGVPSAHCTAGQGVKIRIDGTTTRI